MIDKLSRLNRQRKLMRHQRKLESRIAAQAARPDAVSADEVTAFLRSICLTSTGHSLCRIGSDQDGGYLLADDFDGIVACYSPGVSDEIEFDLALAERGIAVHMADASVDSPTDMRSNMTFLPKFLGAQTEGEFISLEDWIAQSDTGSGDLLLEIDIEGAEYNVLAAVSTDTLTRFRQMVIELHDFDRIYERAHFDMVSALFARLQTHFDIIHLHHNNSLPLVASPSGQLSTVFEATLLRRDRQIVDTALPQLPHLLDRPNVAKHPDEVLPEFYTLTVTPFQDQIP